MQAPLEGAIRQLFSTPSPVSWDSVHAATSGLLFDSEVISIYVSTASLKDSRFILSCSRLSFIMLVSALQRYC